MFLLPSINLKLRPKILDMKPGTRIVANSFNMEDWEADQTETVGGDCTSWCTALLWIVPAKVEGTWTMPQGELKLTQQFQKVTGTLGAQAISEGKLRGDELTFKAGTRLHRQGERQHDPGQRLDRHQEGLRRVGARFSGPRGGARLTSSSPPGRRLPPLPDPFRRSTRAPRRRRRP